MGSPGDADFSVLAFSIGTAFANDLALGSPSELYSGLLNGGGALGRFPAAVMIAR